VAQFSAHLNRAMDNGLTKSEASETLTHLLFYAGWPNVFPQYRWPRMCLTNVPASVLTPIAATPVPARRRRPFSQLQ
jgi:hypothetical protein